MSLDARFRQTLADAIAEVRSRLESEFEATIADVETAAAQDKAAALAAAEDAKTAAVVEARGALQTDLQAAFEADRTSLLSSHQQVLAQVADAARQEMARLSDAVADTDRLRTEAEETQARVRADADATIDAIRAELRDALATALRLREMHEAASTRTAQEHGDAVAIAQQAHETTVAGLTEAHDAKVVQLTGEHQAAVAALREQLDAASRAREEAVADAARVREESAAAVAQARDEAEAALSAARAESREAASLHNHALDAHQTGILRLLEAVRALDASTSLTEVLDALTTGACKEAGRAAMLVVKGDRLIGWRTTGFGAFDTEPRTIETSTNDVSALAAAVNTGRPAVVGSGSVLAAPGFSQAPADRPGLAVPLLVAGKPVAVLYADPGSATPPVGWTSPVEVLVRHASRCLEGLAVQRVTASRSAPARVGVPA